MLAEKQIYFDAWTYESEVNLALTELRLRKYIELRVRLHTAAKSNIYDCLDFTVLCHCLSLRFSIYFCICTPCNTNNNTLENSLTERLTFCSSFVMFPVAFCAVLVDRTNTISIIVTLVQRQQQHRGAILQPAHTLLLVQVILLANRETNGPQ